jgi:transposase
LRRAKLWAQSCLVSEPAATLAAEEVELLKKENAELRELNQLLNLQVKALRAELWGPASERHVPDPGQKSLGFFAEPAAEVTPMAARQGQGKSGGAPGLPKGPKPLDPSLRRETIRVPDPELKELVCPVTGELMQPGFLERIEVLARQPAVYYVKVFERMVFTSPAKSAPAYSPWPPGVLPRARMDASVVGYLAAAHYADHQPFYRIEKQLERVGIDLPRNCQVSLMKQLDERMQPLVRLLMEQVLGSGYVHLDATPMAVADPARSGALREATLWAYRSKAGPVWFQYQPSKSPKHPDLVLRAADYHGIVQTDGASGLGNIGPPGQVTALGCLTHARRPFFKAWKAGERRAERYLLGMNRLFRIDRLAKRFLIGSEKRDRLRQKYSVPLFAQLIAWAQAEIVGAPPKTEFYEGLHYLLAQRSPLERCLSVPGAELSNNAVENSIRPLKLGAKNWLAVGHPAAGPRLANLFTVVENCRQAGIDPEAYLIDLIARMPDHPAKDLAALSPWNWRRTAPTTSAPGSSSGLGR